MKTNKNKKEYSTPCAIKLSFYELWWYCSFFQKNVLIHFEGCLCYQVLEQSMMRTRLTLVRLSPDAGLFLWVEGSPNESDTVKQFNFSILTTPQIKCPFRFHLHYLGILFRRNGKDISEPGKLKVLCINIVKQFIHNNLF